MVLGILGVDLDKKFYFRQTFFQSPPSEQKEIMPRNHKRAPRGELKGSLIIEFGASQVVFK